MNYFFQIIGTAIYGAISTYLIWLFYFWITPYVMSASWLMLIVYAFVGIGIIYGIVAGLSSLLYLPNIYLMRNNKVAQYLYIAICLFIGYSTIALPFHLDGSFGLKEWLLTIMLCGAALSIFLSLIKVTLCIDEE